MALPVTLTLPDSIGTFRFRSVDEIQNFITKESESYLWIQNSLSNLQNNGINASVIQNKWNTFNENIETIRVLFRDNNTDIATDRFLDYFSGGYQFPFSESINGKIIQTVRQELGDNAGLAALATITGGYILPIDPAQIRAVIMVHEALTGTGKTARQSVQNALSAILKRQSDQQLRAEDQADQLDQRIERLSARNRSHFDRLLKAGETARVNFTGQIDGQVGRLGAAAMTAIADISGVQKTFEEHMRLKAPVTYWKGKAAQHRKAAWISGGIGLAFAMALVFYALLDGIGRVLRLVEEVTAQSHQWQSAYVVLTLVIFLLTIAFWIGRLISRTYISQSHLAIDAEERATMVETYLALTKDNQISTDERILVLGSLFRASSDGLVKDDGAPALGIAGLASGIGVK